MITLELPHNYAWKKLLLLYNNSHCLEPTERSDPKKGVLEGIVELPRPFWYRLALGPSPLGGGGGGGGYLELTLTPPDGLKQPTRKDYQAARAWAVRRFWFETDMTAMREALEANFLGFALVGQFWPVVSPAYTSYWASILRAYLGTKLDLKLRTAVADKVSFAGKSYPLLPTPEQMAQVSSLELKSLGLSSWASGKIPYIAEQFLTNERLRLENLPHDPEAALTALRKHSGLGPGSAAWVLMRGAVRADVALEGSHIQRALAEGLGLDGSPKGKEYQELMRVYAPYRSFASYYIHLSQMALWRKNWNLETEDSVSPR